MAFSFPSKEANRSREAIHCFQILLRLERQCRVGARRVYESHPGHGIFETVTTLTIALVRGSANTIRAITPSVYSCCRVVACRPQKSHAALSSLPFQPIIVMQSAKHWLRSDAATSGKLMPRIAGHDTRQNGLGSSKGLEQNEGVLDCNRQRILSESGASAVRSPE